MKIARFQLVQNLTLNAFGCTMYSYAEKRNEMYATTKQARNLIKTVLAGKVGDSWTNRTMKDETSLRRSVGFVLYDDDLSLLSELRKAFLEAGIDESIPVFTDSYNSNSKKYYRSGASYVRVIAYVK